MIPAKSWAAQTIVGRIGAADRACHGLVPLRECCRLGAQWRSSPSIRSSPKWWSLRRSTGSAHPHACRPSARAWQHPLKSAMHVHERVLPAMHASSMPCRTSMDHSRGLACMRRGPCGAHVGGGAGAPTRCCPSLPCCRCPTSSCGRAKTRRLQTRPKRALRTLTVCPAPVPELTHVACVLLLCLCRTDCSGAGVLQMLCVISPHCCRHPMTPTCLQ